MWALGIMAKVLPVTDKTIISQLLSRQAADFDAGAEALYNTKLDPGDSAYFLRLMAIELYFKLVYLIETEALIFGHDLREIFDLLPRETRDAIFKDFNNQPRIHMNLNDFREWLKYTSGLFVQIRYPFEEFRDMELEEYEEKVRAFEEADAYDFSNASIVYHIDRVKALLTSMRGHIDAKSIEGA